MAQRLADILGGHADIHGNGDGMPRIAALDGSFGAQAQAEAELTAHRKRMHAWRDRWQRNAGTTLADLRRFFHDPTLSAEDARAWLDTWLTAVDRPEEFERALAEDDAPQGLAFSASSWFRDLRAYLHAPPSISREERGVLDRLLAAHRWPSVEQLQREGVELNPHIRQFEKLDPWWLGVADENLVTKLGKWPNLEKFVRHSAATPFVYEAEPAELGKPIALFSDFGTGYYHSRMIARQLEQRAPSYAFHLGDVYYAGRQNEFDRYYAEPLRTVVKQSKLFSIAENHELYSGGKWYLDFLRDPAKRGVSPQQGSYFCIRFPHHQLIGIDVNWTRRARFVDAATRQWLSERMASADGRTTILLSGCGPYGYGYDTSYTLLNDLWDHVRNGQIAMWLWGDDHYCALFDRNELIAPFYGSCIGHGGYPAPRERSGKASWSKALWVEDEPRFPAWTGMRDDMLNNGWCELALHDDGGFGLTYLDWLGARRCQVTFASEGGAVRMDSLRIFPRQERPEQSPPLAPAVTRSPRE
jgi:hypothetical protein